VSVHWRCGSGRTEPLGLSHGYHVCSTYRGPGQTTGVSGMAIAGPVCPSTGSVGPAVPSPLALVLADVRASRAVFGVLFRAARGRRPHDTVVRP